ncbi:MAG: hypothetical protein WC444_05185 [Candidatus Paceibacterota bacterium]
MPAKLELVPGAAGMDGTNPATQDAQDIIFEGDNADHICGWVKYVSPELRLLISKILRLGFGYDGAVGTARFDITVATFDAEGNLTGFTVVPFYVSISNVPNYIFWGVFDLTNYIHDNDVVVFILMNRNSSNPGDTLNGDIRFFHGYVE